MDRTDKAAQKAAQGFAHRIYAPRRALDRLERELEELAKEVAQSQQ